MEQLPLPLERATAYQPHPNVAIDAARSHFRRQVRRGRALGPLDYWHGLWALTVEGWDPWAGSGSKKDPQGTCTVHPVGAH